MRLLGLLLAATAVASWPLPTGPERRRLAAVRDGSTAVATGDWPVAQRAGRWLVCTAAGLSVALAWGGPVGLFAGLTATAGGLRLLARADSAGERRRRERRAEDLPAALDLLCVCLRAGLPVNLALSQVAGVLSGPLRDDLALVCALHDLGADARGAWSELAGDPVLAPVARAMSRAGASGGALAIALAGVAEQCRGQRQEKVEVAARRVGVFVMAPLGLCFLPAFVCLGVVPTILGIASDVLG